MLHATDDVVRVSLQASNFTNSSVMVGPTGVASFERVSIP